MQPVQEIRVRSFRPFRMHRGENLVDVLTAILTAFVEAANEQGEDGRIECVVPDIPRMIGTRRWGIAWQIAGASPKEQTASMLRVAWWRRTTTLFLDVRAKRQSVSVKEGPLAVIWISQQCAPLALRAACPERWARLQTLRNRRWIREFKRLEIPVPEGAVIEGLRWLPLHDGGAAALVLGDPGERLTSVFLVSRAGWYWLGDAELWQLSCTRQILAGSGLSPRAIAKLCEGALTSAELEEEIRVAHLLNSVRE